MMLPMEFMLDEIGGLRGTSRGMILVSFEMNDKRGRNLRMKPSEGMKVCNVSVANSNAHMQADGGKMSCAVICNEV